MEPAAFGEVQTLVSLFLQFTIFLNVLSMLTVTIVANYANTARAHHVIFELEKLASYVALGLLALSIIGSEFLRQTLHFQSPLPFVAFGLALLVSVPLTFRSAYARGHKRFGIASLSQLISAAAKVALSAGFVILGFGTFGAIGGIVLAQLIAFFYAARWAGRLGFQRPAGVNYSRLPDLKVVAGELRYASFVLGGLLSITLLMSIDIVLVKYYFDAETAGLYAGIATVARVIFFLSAPIAQVLMPMVKIKQSPRENHQLLAKSLGLTILVTSPALIACIIAPEFVISLLMGSTYTAYAYLLPVLALALFLISVMNLLCIYYLSLRRKAVTIIGIAGFCLSLSLMLTWHDNLDAIVTNVLIGAVFMVCTTGAYILLTLKRGVRDAKSNGIDRYTNL